MHLVICLTCKQIKLMKLLIYRLIVYMIISMIIFIQITIPIRYYLEKIIKISQKNHLPQRVVEAY